MSELIPLLWELAATEDAAPNGARRGFLAPPPTSGWPGVPSEFVPMFVKIHHGADVTPAAAVRSARNGNRDIGWRTAQAHWEVVVARVLDTDIVKPNVSGELAIRRAVRASALLLNKMARQGRCPICPQPAMVSSH
ncbi:hypothetical protein [Cryptosporangium aurantiacum]|uniref:Uncharacterized protein n=1 Tax=Cryptosporangium aurantiacum TaxID=134849 RepID=A0A1M7HCP8_9ACTN|nr:hypothetical protein [Cryptosporangium aurantiacum]SHM26362.1 hypothetical protein SAMN05443668_101149 [Cryptosporangium aurantiacum]